MRSVYKFADIHNGFYTTRRRRLISNDGTLNIAFTSLKEARQFLRDVKGIHYSGERVDVNAKLFYDEVYYGVEAVVFADEVEFCGWRAF